MQLQEIDISITNFSTLTRDCETTVWLCFKLWLPAIAFECWHLKSRFHFNLKSRFGFWQVQLWKKMNWELNWAALDSNIKKLVPWLSIRLHFCKSSIGIFPGGPISESFDEEGWRIFYGEKSKVVETDPIKAFSAPIYSSLEFNHSFSFHMVEWLESANQNAWIPALARFSLKMFYSISWKLLPKYHITSTRSRYKKCCNMKASHETQNLTLPNKSLVFQD